MLIRNISKVIVEVQIELLFDDNSVKKDIIRVGDEIKVVYRKNFKKIENIGVVKSITTRMDNRVNSMNQEICKSSFIHPYLEIDFSEDFKSSNDRISVDDILDFEVIQRSSVNSENFSVGYGAIDYAEVYGKYHCQENDDSNTTNDSDSNNCNCCSDDEDEDDGYCHYDYDDDEIEEGGFPCV